MEDSYTVHRRRKAAARKREKTPDPPRLRAEESGEDDSLARSKIERMVEDTENMAEWSRGKFTIDKEIKVADDKPHEEIDIPVKNHPGIVQETQVQTGTELEVKKVKNLSPKREESGKFRPEEVAENSSVVVVDEPRDSDAPNFERSSINTEDQKSRSAVDGDKNLEGAKSELNEAVDPPQEDPCVIKKIEEPGGDAIAKTGPSKNGEPIRPKKRTKDKIPPERIRGLGTESSDEDEKVPVSVRRKKSPEVPRPRTAAVKSQGKSRASANDTDEDRNTSNNESRPKKTGEKRYPSKQRYSTGTEDDSSPKKADYKIGDGLPDVEPRAKIREKRSLSRHRYPSDTDDDFNGPMMKKSETFPQKSSDKQTVRRSASEIKKQIIPLSDDSLIQDFAKAQEDYLRRERGIMGPDFMDDDYLRRSDARALRKRKLGVLHPDPEEMVKNRVKGDIKKSWFSWVPWFRKKEKIDEPSPDKTVEEKPTAEKVSFMEFLRALQEIISEFKAFVEQNPRETAALKRSRNRCIGELILVIIYCGLGAFVFRFTEGAFETFYKCGVKRVKRDFLDNLWNYSHNMREEDWKSMARRKLMEFEEQLHNAHEAGVHTYSGQKSWTFLNAVSYCLTVITTIGYGHISPRTTAGRAITIVYAIFGIPIFLIILADFGKLFTRGIKFLWAFVRRLYYTGSCRKVRRTGPVQEVMKGVQLVYDFATFRRPSQFNQEEVEEMQRQQIHTETVLNLDGNVPIPETPGTPAMSNFAIDDEFNLPISVAITILLGYIFVGATAYHMFEEWDFFESFYFVFISMSTIGFGDFVPKNPIFMMFSIVYLVFGLALTSMCINVVQTVLSDSFKQASQKISATIGFEVPPEEGEEGVPVEGEGDVEASDVQVTVKEPEEKREEIAPKAKQEDVDV